MRAKPYCVYIMTNFDNTVLYIGVTGDLPRRIYQHKHKLTSGFTARYNICKLVYYETTMDVKAAIGREKQLKGGSRQNKIRLISSINPEWKDLAEEL
jgi:putative endonuclease